MQTESDSLKNVDWEAVEARDLTVVEESHSNYSANRVVDRFEDLRVWQAAIHITQRIYTLSGSESFRKDRALRDQTCRSAISISSNIAEGFERGSRPEFIQFLNYAKGSAGELRSQVHLAYHLHYIAELDYQETIADCELVSRQLYAMMHHLKQKPKS